VRRRRGKTGNRVSWEVANQDSSARQAAPAGVSIGKKAGRGVLWLGLANTLDKAAQIVTVLLSAAFLSASEFGVVTVAISLVTLGQIFQSAGVFDVLAREHGDAKLMASTLVTLSLGVSIVTGVLFVLLAPMFMGFLGVPEAASLVQVCALALPFFAYSGAQSGVMHRELDFRRRVLPEAGSSLVAAGLAVTGLVMGMGIWAMALWILSKPLLQAALGLAVGIWIAPGWRTSRARVVVRWFRVTAPGAVIGVLLLNVDYYFVTRALGASAAGIYSFAFRIAFLPYVAIAIVIGAVSFPVFARLIRQGEADKVPGAAEHFVHGLCLVTGGAYLIAALTADRVVVVSETWSGSVPLLRLLCVYGMLLGLVLMGYELLRASNRPQLALAGQALHLLLLTGLLAVGTQRGLMVVCGAQIAAVLVTLVVVWRWVRRHGLAVPGRLLAGVRGGAAAAVLTVGVWALLYVTDLRPPVTSFAGGTAEVIGLAVTFVIGLALFDRAAVRDVRSLVTP